MFLALNTAVCASVLLSLAVIKLVVPVNAVRRRIDPLLNGIAEQWIANNDLWIALVQDIDWHVRGAEGLRRNGWYLVEANHQSWVDIFVLQHVLSRRIPMLKFFLKRQLIWVPLIGLAWWALDFPFMRRYSSAYLREHPEKRGSDLARIRRSCQKFSLIPTSVMNFLEGTRFTAAKQQADGSPFRHLLRPKSAGIALALNAMGERFQALLDVTLFYPQGVPVFGDLLGGNVREVVVVLRELPVPHDLIGGDYASDPEFRSRMQAWVNELWTEKDRLLDQLEFKDQLHRSLERRNALPTAVSTALDVTPYVVVQDAEGLIDFVKNAFDAEERFRAIGSAGGIHCEVNIAGTRVFIGGGGKWHGTPSPAALHLFVDDVDSRYRRALAAGATSLHGPVNQEYGVREASVRDAYGNEWYLARDLGVDDFWKGVPPVMPYFHPVGAAAMIDFLREALGAEVLHRFEEQGSVMHARVQIGRSMIEMGEAHGQWGALPMHMYVTVGDADAAYARAVAAGASSITPPADAPYGRTAAVDDPFGNRWYLVAPK